MKKPADLIPKDSMELIITDMLIAGASQNEKNVEFRKNINYIQFVSTKYNVDSTRFKNSNLYYISKIDDYEKILQKVKKNLEEIKTKLSEENKEQILVKKPLKESNLKPQKNNKEVDPEDETKN